MFQEFFILSGHSAGYFNVVKKAFRKSILLIFFKAFFNRKVIIQILNDVNLSWRIYERWAIWKLSDTRR